MFEPAPKAAPRFALQWVALVAIVGGCVGIAIGAWLFGEESFQSSDAVMFGSFAIGALLGLILGWKLIRPYRPSP
jgi:H+/Cl- antiporter ClcA